MAKYFLVTLVLMFAGCGDDAEPAPIDAPDEVTPDAPTADAASTVDASTACTGAAYDPCTDDTQCMSAMCQAFTQAGFSACTQSCDANTPCPMQGGVAVECNNRGICRPTMTNDCTR